MNNEVIHNIEELFKTWYFPNTFSSIKLNPNADENWIALVDYCKKNIEEFKDFAKDTLEHPYEWCPSVVELCEELLPECKPSKDRVSLLERFVNLSQMTINNHYYREALIFQPCNDWLNYFNGTSGIDYYKDYVMYKEYLDKHYIGWNPFKEDDPNPSYEEFVNNKEKYKI